jgi:hypothetical protein
LSGSTTKKALIDRFDRVQVRGFVNPQTYLQAEGVELLSPDGGVATIPFGQIKVLSFVRTLEGEGVLGDRREFLARPKAQGLWVELKFRDGDRMEGILPNNLVQLEPLGFSFMPPDSTGNTQKVFVPKGSLESLTVLGVVGSALRKRRPERASTQQITLFSEE